MKYDLHVIAVLTAVIVLFVAAVSDVLPSHPARGFVQHCEIGPAQ